MKRGLRVINRFVHLLKRFFVLLSHIEIEFLINIRLIMISAGACASRLLCLSRHFLFSTDKTPLYKFKYGFNIIPHPAKAHKGGEDAVFAS